MNTSSRMEIQDMAGKRIMRFSYNPSSISYSCSNQFYTVEFLQSNRSVQEFLRSGKMQISGEGNFISESPYQNDSSVGISNMDTAIGRWKNFLKVFKKKQKDSPYFKLVNPVMGDARTVVFREFSTTLSGVGYSIPFNFTAIETDIISNEEKNERFTAYNINSAKYITAQRVKEIEENISKYISDGNSISDAKAWALKGKILGSAEYQLAEAYIEYKSTINTDPEASDKYFQKQYAILENNARLAKLSDTQTNALENSDSSNGNSYTEYIIKSGDTLSGIALMFYRNGTRKYSESIYDENHEVIEEAAILRGKKSSRFGWWIYPGTKIRIPNAIVSKPTRIVRVPAPTTVSVETRDGVSHPWYKEVNFSEAAQVVALGPLTYVVKNALDKGVTKNPFEDLYNYE